MSFTFPDPIVTTEFTGDNGITYSWDAVDGKWQIKRYAADFDDRYVNEEGGDTMEGPLQVTGPRSANADGLEGTVKALNIDSGQNSSLNLKWNGATKVYVGDDQTSFQGDIKFNVGGRAIYAGNDKKAFVINDGGAFYDGAYSVDRHVATKKNVDEAIYHDILDTDTNKYVDRAGDSMSGPLVIEDTEVRFNNRSDGQTLIRAGRNEAEFPMLLDLRNPGGSVEGGYDIKIQGNTAYNQLRFVGNDTYLTMNGGGGAQDRVMFNIDISLENNRIENLGRAVNDTDAVPYGQVEEELAEFRDELVSNLTFGTWQYASGSVNPVIGRCYFRSDGGQTSGIAPSQVAQMIFNVTDITGAIGAFDRIDIGEIISLTNGTVTIKYKVNSAASTSGSDNSTRTFDVNYISQTGPQTFIDGIQWTFTLTEFTDVSVDQLDDTYLRLDCSNDPLDTQLEIKTPDFGEAALTLNGKRDNANNSCATVAFRNQFATAEAYAGYLTYRTNGSTSSYFRFNRDLDLNTKSLTGVSDIEMTPGGSIGSSTNKRLTFNNATSGNDGDGLLVVPRPASPRRGFVIRGNTATNTEQDLLFSYTNSTGSDAVNYVGKMSSDTNLVNKGYVDSKMPEYTITESNGNYYIS